MYILIEYEGIYGEHAYEFWIEPATNNLDFTPNTRNALDSWNSAKEIEACTHSNHPENGYHFTQLVWKASKKSGCAWSTDICSGNSHKGWWFYCEFVPRGNILGYFGEHVTA